MDEIETPPVETSLIVLKSRRLQMIASVAFLILIVSGFFALTKKNPGEYIVYTRAANRLLQGETFYRTDEISAFPYPPFIVFLGVPFSFLPETIGRFAWYVTNFTVLVTIILLLKRIIQPVLLSPLHQRNPHIFLSLFLIGLLSARHLSSPIENQSHEFFVLLFVVLTLFQLGKNNSPKSGIWVGFAAASKATPLLFLPFFLWQRRFKTAFVMLLVIVGATLSVDLFFQNPDGELWGMSWYHKFASHAAPGKTANAAGAWTDWNILNQSLAGTFFRLTVPLPYKPNGNDLFHANIITLSREQSRWLTLFFQLSVGAIVFFLTLSRKKTGTIPPAEKLFLAVGQGAVVVCGMLLLSPMTSKAHLCLLLLPISYCVTDFVYRQRSYFVGAMLTIVFLTGTLASKGLVGSYLGNRLLGYGFPTWSIFACLFATGYTLNSRAKTLRIQEFK